MNKINNIPILRMFRKELRNNLTPAEAKLWTLLKQSQLSGRKFRRQHSVGYYILDFYCPSESLAVELDGAAHDSEAAQEYDRERDIFLNCFGIKVLRFENRLVFQQTEAVLMEIENNFGWSNSENISEPACPKATTPPCGHPEATTPPFGHPSLKRRGVL